MRRRRRRRGEKEERTRKRRLARERRNLVVGAHNRFLKGKRLYALTEELKFFYDD